MSANGTFDPAAEFLLNMQWPNLYERADATPGSNIFRCKGCGLMLMRSGRESHYTYERRALSRRNAARRKEVQREAAKRLQAARLLRRKEATT